MNKRRRVLRRWAVEWYARNQRDGVTSYVLWKEPTVPALFLTRQAARAWIERQYGYIRHRRDLRTEPHGWRLPRAIRVDVDIKPVRQ
jgi:hypothetical protein